MNIEDQIRAIVRDEIAKHEASKQPVEPKTEPDPGEGWRLVDTEKEEWGPDVEYWTGQTWLLTSSHSPGFAKGRIYRRRIEPTPQYREPTNEDIGKMVRVSVTSEDKQWSSCSYELCCVLDYIYDNRFVVKWKDSYFTYRYARIRCDGGEQ